MKQMPLCKCGCGEEVIIRFTHPKRKNKGKIIIPNYVFGHYSRTPKHKSKLLKQLLSEQNPGKSIKSRLMASIRMLKNHPLKDPVIKAKHDASLRTPKNRIEVSIRMSKTNATPKSIARMSGNRNPGKLLKSRAKVIERNLINNPSKSPKAIERMHNNNPSATPDGRERSRINRIKIIMPRDKSKPRLKIESLLTEMGIRFKTEVLVLDEKGKPRHRTDIFLPDYDTKLHSR